MSTEKMESNCKQTNHQYWQNWCYSEKMTPQKRVQQSNLKKGKQIHSFESSYVLQIVLVFKEREIKVYR